MAEQKHTSIILEMCFVYENYLVDEVPEHEFYWIRVNNNTSQEELFKILDIKYNWRQNTAGYAIKEIQFKQYINYEIIYNPSCLRWLREANNKIFFVNGKLHTGIVCIKIIKMYIVYLL